MADPSRRDGAGHQLPYDPDQWEQRLAEAREAREKVLAAREAPHPRGAGAPPAAPSPLVLDRGAAPAGRGGATSKRGAPPQAKLGGAGLRRAAGLASGLAAGLLALAVLALWSEADTSAPTVDIGDVAQPVPSAAERAAPAEAVPEAELTAPPGPTPGVPVAGAGAEEPGATPPGATRGVPAGESGAERAREEVAGAAPPGATPDVPAGETAAERAQEEATGGEGSVAVTAARSGEMPAPGGAAQDAAANLDEPSPPRPPPIPDGEGRLVRLHAGARVAAEDVSAVVELLDEAGYGVERTRPAGLSPRETQVRFFRGEDEEAAVAIAARLAGRSRDFRSYRPLPETGTIEVWLGE